MSPCTDCHGGLPSNFGNNLILILIPVIGVIMKMSREVTKRFRSIFNSCVAFLIATLKSEYYGGLSLPLPSLSPSENEVFWRYSFDISKGFKETAI